MICNIGPMNCSFSFISIFFQLIFILFLLDNSCFFINIFDLSMEHCLVVLYISCAFSLSETRRCGNANYYFYLCIALSWNPYRLKNNLPTNLLLIFYVFACAMLLFFKRLCLNTTLNDNAYWSAQGRSLCMPVSFSSFLP